MQRSVAGRPGPAILDDAVIQSDEVAANGHVFRADVEVDSECFENTAADAVFERVVAEKPEMAWAAAGRDSRQNRQTQPADAIAGTSVQVRRSRRF